MCSALFIMFITIIFEATENNTMIENEKRREKKKKPFTSFCFFKSQALQKCFSKK